MEAEFCCFLRLSMIPIYVDFKAVVSRTCSDSINGAWITPAVPIKTKFQNCSMHLQILEWFSLHSSLLKIWRTVANRKILFFYVVALAKIKTKPGA